MTTQNHVIELENKINKCKDEIWRLESQLRTIRKACSHDKLMCTTAEDLYLSKTLNTTSEICEECGAVVRRVTEEKWN